jgi:uncharacterized repeat protein (TIGR03803 family)
MIWERHLNLYVPFPRFDGDVLDIPFFRIAFDLCTIESMAIGDPHSSPAHHEYCRTIFKITPSGTLTTLYNFWMQAGCPDGETPYAGLMQATDGNLYGATQFRGANYGNGTIFRCTLDGTLTTLHIFEETDGSEPLAPLMQATDGNFYGTTIMAESIAAKVAVARSSPCP